MKENDAHVITYSANDLTDVIEGATLLATGGGGPAEVAKHLLEQSGVQSVDVARAPFLPDEMKLAMSAQVFAPSAIWANQDYRSALNSFNALVPPTGIRGVLPAEVGAVNSIIPVIVASLSGACLLADTQTDRSMPEMDMGLFQGDVPFNRLEMVTKEGEVALVKEYSPDETDGIIPEQEILEAMNNTPGFQGVGGFATYTMDGSQFNRIYDQGGLMDNTLDYARKLGSCMDGPGFETAIFQTIQEHLGPDYSPCRLFRGRLVATKQQSHSQDYGYADFITSDPQSCMGARIYYSNENMIAYHLLWVLVQGVPTPMELSPMAMGPDSIGYLLMEGECEGFKKGHSFTNEAFEQGHGAPDFFKTHEIELIGIPEPRLRKPAIIDAFTREIKRSREAFGKAYSGEYIPIEHLTSLCFHVDIPREGDQPGEGSHITMETGVTGAKIRYTLDGTEPNQGSPLYQSPLPLAGIQGKTLKATLYDVNERSGMTITLPLSGI
jgi:DUF917 family protein